MSVCDMSLKNRYTSVDDHLPTHPEAIINKNPNDTEKRIQKKRGVTYMRKPVEFTQWDRAEGNGAHSTYMNVFFPKFLV